MTTAGASRGNLWGGALGSCAWLLVLVGLVVVGRVPASLAAVVGIPYVAGVALLFWLRGRTGGAAWMGGLWIFLGLYLAYAWAVLRLWPGWGGVLAGAGPGLAPASLLVFGLSAAVAGCATLLWSLVRARRQTRISGRPDQEEPH